MFSFKSLVKKYLQLHSKVNFTQAAPLRKETEHKDVIQKIPVDVITLKGNIQLRL